MSKTQWAVVTGVPGTLLVSAAVVFLPPAWLTLVVGICVFLFTLSNPIVGMIMLFTVLQYSVFPTVRIGPLEFSASTIPAVGLGMGAWVRQRAGVEPVLKTWQQGLLVLLVVVYLITTLLSTDYAKTLPLTLNLILYVVILFGLMSAVNRPEHLVLLAKTVIVLTIIAVLWRELGPLRAIIGIPSLGVNGMIFGIYPAMGICLTLVSRPLNGFSPRWRWLALVALLAMAWRILTFEARAGALAGLVLLAIVAIVYRAFFKPLYVFAIVGALLLVGIFFQDLVQANFIQTQNTMEAFLDNAPEYRSVQKDDQVRLIARDAALRMFAERPMTGWGPNLYVSLKPSFAVGPQFLATAQTAGAFNSWMIVLAEMGLVGIISTALVVAVPVVISFHALWVYQDDLARLAFAFALGVIGLTIHLFFIDLFYSFVWAHVGLALAAARLSWHTVGNRSLIAKFASGTPPMIEPRSTLPALF